MNKATAVLRTCGLAHVRKAYLVIYHRLDTELRDSGLTASQFMILAGLGQRDYTHLSALARELGVDRTTLYRTIRPLEGRGLVVIQRPAGRGRRRLAGLTPGGREALERGLAAWERFHRATREAYGAERWPALISALAWLARPLP